MNKKVLVSLLVTIFIFSIFAVAKARMFDVRTDKISKEGAEISFDNLPHLQENAYSGIYVGDSVKISGRSVNGREVKIVFPSGKSITLTIIDTTKNYFEKTITFDEEGTYKIEPMKDKCFEVCYRAISLNAIFLKDIVGERVTNDDYDKNFVNWNNAVASSLGMSVLLGEPLPTFSLLITDSNGNPLPNLKANKFTTNESGIATIAGNPDDSIIYGGVRIIRYKKFIFDKDGHFIYCSSGQKLNDGFFDNGKLFIDAKNFISNNFSVDYANDITMADNYIMFRNGVAYPAIVKDKNSVKYVNAESVLASINTRSLGIMGTAIEYGNDKTILYVALSGVR